MRSGFRVALGAAFLMAASTVAGQPPMPGSTSAAKEAKKLMGQEPLWESAANWRATSLPRAAKLYRQACAQSDVRGCSALLEDSTLYLALSVAERAQTFARANALYKELCAAGVEDDDVWACGDWLDFVDDANDELEQRPEFGLTNPTAPYSDLAVAFLGECRKATKLQSAEASTCQTALTLAEKYNQAVRPQVVAHICSLGYPCGKKPAAPASN